MPQLMVFNHLSLDGFFTDARGDMSFAHNTVKDPEWDAFVQSNAAGGGVLVFGRVTYDLMASYWPTPAALKSMPLIAERMNNLPKIVFSRSMTRATWNNTRLIKDDLVGEMKRLKQGTGPGMVIMGSGTIVAQLTTAKLIDQYQLVVNPVILGAGRTLFEGVEAKLPLALTRTRSFANGNTLLCYDMK